MSPLLSLDNLTAKRGDCPVVDSVSLTIGQGECVGLIGPNGAGKTTLMRAALGLMPSTGRSSLTALTSAKRAHAAAWLPQAREIAWPVTVENVVALGRTPHLPRGAKLSAADQAAVSEALAQMDLDSFRSRLANQLSGGEQARVLIARALAQQTPLLMVDEPIAGLDPAHQISTMQAFQALTEQGKSTLVSLHDLGLAARHCTRILLMSKGCLVADGTPQEVLTPKLMHDVFGISVHFEHTSEGPVFQPLGLT